MIDKEIARSHYGVSSVPFDTLSRLALDIIRDTLASKTEPLPWEAVCMLKGASKNPGAPTSYEVGTFGHVVSLLIGREYDPAEDFEECVRVVTPIMEGFEEYLLAGGATLEVYFATPKNDLHPLSKLDKDQLRSICVPHVWAMLMVARWFGGVDSGVKVYGEGIYAITSRDGYEEKVGYLREYNSVGVDLSMYDKTIPIDVCYAVYLAYLDRTLLDDQRDPLFGVRNFLFSQTVVTVVVSPSGDVFVQNGSTPSGSFLTSGWNSFAHRLIYRSASVLCAANFPLVAAVPGFKDIATMKMGCTSDDSIYAQPVDVLDPLAGFTAIPVVYSLLFGVVVKLDLLEGGVFPPGVQPPYLCLVEHWGWVGKYALLPADPGRRVSGMIWGPSLKGVTTRDWQERYDVTLMGLLDSIANSRVAAQQTGVPLPIPFSMLLRTCEERGLPTRIRREHIHFVDACGFQC